MLVLVAIIIALIIVNGLLKNWHVQPLNAAVLILISISFLFNSRGYLKFSRAFFIIWLTILIVIASISAFHLGKFTETENNLYIILFLTVFLAQGLFKYGFGVIILTSLFILKWYKNSLLGGELDTNFYLNIINTSVAGFTIFIFGESFRYLLQKSFQEIERQKAQLFALIDNLPLFIAAVDREWRYILVNKRFERFGKSRKEILGARVSEVLPPALFDRHMHLIEKAFEGEQPSFIEQAEMTDGSIIHSAGRYVPIRNENGEIKSITVFASDIGELKKTEAALIEANKMKDRLLSIVAHDIKNPLNLFHSLLHIDDESALDAESFKRYKEGMKVKLRDLNETIDQILNWGRTQMDGINAYPELINVSKILHDNLTHYHDFALKKKVILKEEIHENLFGYIDENHLRVVIRNIVHNALKFTPEGKVILVKTQVEPGFVGIVISDEGIGMTEDKISKIHRGDVQSSTEGTSGESGTGLGLSMCVELLKKNNCELHISSVLNKGSTFLIKIPIKASQK